MSPRSNSKEVCHRSEIVDWTQTLLSIYSISKGKLQHTFCQHILALCLYFLIALLKCINMYNLSSPKILEYSVLINTEAQTPKRKQATFRKALFISWWIEAFWSHWCHKRLKEVLKREFRGAIKSFHLEVKRFCRFWWNLMMILGSDDILKSKYSLKRDGKRLESNSRNFDN